MFSLLRDEFSDGSPIVHEQQTTAEAGEWRLFFDGGSRGNPGITGAGAVLAHNDEGYWKLRWAVYEYLGERSTNNRAESASLCLGLEEVETRELAAVTIMGDSQLILQHMNGNARVHAKHLKAHHHRAQELMEIGRAFKFRHTYREHNKMADRLANAAMDRRASRAVSFDAPDDHNNDLRGEPLPLMAQDLRFNPHNSRTSKRPDRYVTAVTDVAQAPGD